jgi:hypothetical protein
MHNALGEENRSALTNIGQAGGAVLSPDLLKQWGQHATFVRLLGVNYIHVTLPDKSELYLTEHGLPFLDHIHPDNWYEPDWFKKHRQPLLGTGTVYRIPSRPVPGHKCRSIDLVIKWSRMGQDVPLDTFTLNQAINAEFNTPFEEFSLVEELRTGTYGRQDLRIFTQRPMAIYVPSERMQLWQTGRSRWKILSKIKYHACIEIDILRSYIMIYSWIKGVDAAQVARAGMYPGLSQEASLKEFTNRTLRDLEEKGFFVADHKPSHLILHIRRDRIVRKRNGDFAYGLVDYELLTRTEEHQAYAKAASRSRYLQLQRDRLNPPADVVVPPHLHRVRLREVDYVFGRAESTAGVLWVVGKDPRLFEYFLPERWRKKLFPLSGSARTWYTQTKDGVHLVWKISRVGEEPRGLAADPRWSAMRRHGYNSPFEEFKLAMELTRKGIHTSYPRAIYVTGHGDVSTSGVTDERRFQEMQGEVGPDGQPVLRIGHDYITIWGYFRGHEDLSAPDATVLYSPIGAGQAHAKALLTDDDLDELIRRHLKALAVAGYEDLNFEPDHILLSYMPGGDFQRDNDGCIATRHCNLEMLTRIGSEARL